MRFDLDHYKGIVAPLQFDDLDLDAFRDQPLAPGALRCLRYMHDVELHTICYLRDLLVTSAHRDPTITTFLTFWSYEEYWHGEAIGRVLGAHGEAFGEARVRPLRRARKVKEGVKPFLHGLGSVFAGTDMSAVHMTWGAINEWTTQAGYSRLIAQADHPLLTELLRRIMKQEGRHIDFYASQARERLAASPRAQKLTRFALSKMWGAVGSDLMQPAEVQHLISYLFGDADGRDVAARVDRRIDQLPGLAGLGLVSGAVDRYAGPGTSGSGRSSTDRAPAEARPLTSALA